MEGTTPPKCLLLDRLPPEIRLEIFKYVLAARFNIYETRMKSKEYASRRAWLLRGPDHSIRFSTSIMRVNHQIHREAYNVFIQENSFIMITHEALEPCWYSEIKLEECGAVVLARASWARSFPKNNIAMSIDVKAGYIDESTANLINGEFGRRYTSIIAVEDLPAACVALQRKIFEHDAHSRNVEISIRISPQVGKVSIRSRDGSPATGTKLHRCLKPLRALRWIYQADINGCENEPYLGDITATMCGNPLSAAETMTLVAEHVNRGDKALVEGAAHAAIDVYKDAINILDSSAFHDLESDEVLQDGMFKGVTAAWARDEAKIRLHTRIARILLRTGSHRLARVYVERIYGPLHSMDERGWDTKFPLELPGGHGEAYAELLVVAAQISLSHGQFRGAYDELQEASCLDPENQEFKRLQDKCENLFDRYRSKKAKWTQKRDREHKFMKVCGPRFHHITHCFMLYKPELTFLAEAIEIARTRNAKGDEASKNNKKWAALRKYEAAYAKLRKLEGHCKNNWSSTATSLAVEILPKLPTTCLEIKDYEAVHYWADVILDFVPGYIYRQNEIDAYMRTARFTAYSSKAFALQKQGEISDAIQNYEKALSLDGKIYMAIKELEALKALEQSRNLERKLAE